MSHYFETPTDPGRDRNFEATLWGNQLTFTTSSGVFSGSRIDLGTSVLLREVAPPDRGRILDLGCGFGPIAVGLARASDQVVVDAIDVNDRALELTRLNARANGVDDRVNAMRPDQVPPEISYDEIWSNPPIRIGKEALHELLTTWLARLKPAGAAHLVVGRNLGADSLQRWLNDEGFDCERLASAKGFRVFQVRRN